MNALEMLAATILQYTWFIYLGASVVLICALIFENHDEWWSLEVTLMILVGLAGTWVPSLTMCYLPHGGDDIAIFLLVSVWVTLTYLVLRQIVRGSRHWRRNSYNASGLRNAPYTTARSVYYVTRAVRPRF